MRPLLLALVTISLATSLAAEVVPNFLFADNAVLQRDKPVPVWGTATAGEQVSVAFAGHTVSTTADKTGAWRVNLPAMPANATPGDLVISGSNTVTCKNVVVGEVWLASGQSNMEQTVKETYDAALDIPGSARHPLIRHLRIDYTVNETPLSTASGSWKAAGPKTTGEFTAIGYYFALSLHEVLGVPVGLVNNARGGSNIRGWVDPVALATDPELAEIAKVWGEHWTKSKAAYPAAKAKLDADIAAWEAERDAAKQANKPFNKPRPAEIWSGLPGGPNDQGMPSGLFNGMINPLLPYALRGAIWYQGEANVGGHGAYAKIFPAMIRGWRKQFGQGDVPFYWAQLASYNSPTGTAMAFLREAQAQALALPATGQAITIDVGDIGNIHPLRKQPVGRRLARLALARTYGQKVLDRGPVFKEAVRDGAGYRVTFTHTGGQHRLVTLLNTVEGFELAGADRVFKPAVAVIGKDYASVLVTSAEVPDPIAVRYAWRDAVVASLYNREGLPAEPFRSDTWDK